MRLDGESQMGKKVLNVSKIVNMKETLVHVEIKLSNPIV
jgi:hypothetical protein